MPRPPAPCGTNKGYQRHRRNKEKPCAACARAHRQGNNKYRGGRVRDYPICGCGRRITTDYDQCALCRRTTYPKNTADLEIAYQGGWTKTRRGIFLPTLIGGD